MATPSFDIGVMGLGVMGANLGLNLASHGIRVAGFNHTSGKAEAFTQRAVAELGEPGLAVGITDLASFIDSLHKPRIILLLVPANIVDSVLGQIKDKLAPGDIVIDGGNSHYPDTERRLTALTQQGLHYIGMGVSGGEDGARHGPSMMPGGESAAWPVVQPLLEPASAMAHDGKPCVAWMGQGGAGHFVKMVHNGIEYAIMQLIAEAYDLLHRGAGMDNATLHNLFASWRNGPLSSYLIEITADVLAQSDDMEPGALVDHIRDKAGQKGTGRWTCHAGFELGVPIPIIDSAVSARGLSGFYEERQQVSKTFTGPMGIPTDPLLSQVAGALEAGMILAYSQGFHLIAAANLAYAYQTPLESVVRIWRAGCIIRAAMLDDFLTVYGHKPDTLNPAFDEMMARRLSTHESSLRALVSLGTQGGIPLPAFSSALAYYDSWRSARLPSNLIQAQRDFFGAHTYERLDREGHFHTQWKHQPINKNTESH